MTTYYHELTERFKKEISKEYLGLEKPVNSISPLVSVTVTTYQHKDYIRQCLDGILAQQTSFPFEIIIGEDGSTDGTADICKEYAKKYPDKIRLWIRDRKFSQYLEEGSPFRMFNLEWCRMSARGKYQAMCEGDDYWTDPLKLQKQVDFLDAHPEHSVVFHDFLEYYQNKNEWIEREKPIPLQPGAEGFSFNSFWDTGSWITQPLTAVFRSEVYQKIDFSPYDYKRDVHTFYHLLKLGKGYWMNEVMGVYRRHDKGAAAGLDSAGSNEIGYKVYREIALNNPEDSIAEIALSGISAEIISSQILGIYHTSLKNLEILRENLKISLFTFFKTLTQVGNYLLKKIKRKIKRF